MRTEQPSPAPRAFGRVPLFSILLIGLGILSAGCTSRPPQTASASRGASLPEDTLASVREALSKGTDLMSYRGALQQLGTYLANRPEERPEALSQAARQLLTDRFALGPEELAEVENSNFTLLDAYHLDSALLLRDAARTLQVESLAPLERARAAFAWAVRQVRLRDSAEAMIPGQYVVRRGWGTDQERALVFLGLLEQLGISGCMIGFPGQTEQASPRYWIPGALVDKDICLFDTRMGIPLPGPGGKGIATLAQVRTQGDSFQSLRIDDKHTYDVAPEQAKQAEVYLACSLSSLAPRMRTLQAMLGSDEKVHLGVDPVALVQKFEAATQGPAFAKHAVRVWNERGNPNTPTHVLRAFLPPEEGGTDRMQRAAQYQARFIPWTALPPLIQQLPGEPGQRLQKLFATPFIAFAIQPKMPRDHILRGRYGDASNQLVGVLEETRRNKEQRRVQANLEEQVAEWCTEALDTYGAFVRAQREVSGPAGARAALEAAQQRVEALWKASGKAEILVRGAAAEPMGAYVTYQLALCKHEEALRNHAWKRAADWWDTFLIEYPTAPEAAHARLLRAEALAAMGRQDAAVTLLRDLSGGLSNLEETARLYRARQLQP